MPVRREAGERYPTTHLFLLRVWLEEVGADQVEWRGQIQNVHTGEQRYFRDWSTLNIFIQGMASGEE